MTDTLHQRIAERVDAWRAEGYPCEEYPAIGEVLEWSRDPETGTLRYLREPQFRALEVYGFLRLVEETPRIPALYQTMFPPEEDVAAYLDALGVPEEAFRTSNYSLDRVLARIQEDDAFAHEHKLEALRETLALDYPSYILALAMGPGKTILIGAVVATEFAMALEYPDGPFVQNALVFAPGTTIIEPWPAHAEVVSGRPAGGTSRCQHLPVARPSLSLPPAASG